MPYDDADDSLVEFGESPADYRRAHGIREPRQFEPLTTSLAAGFVVGMTGIVGMMREWPLQVTTPLLGAAAALSLGPVVAIFRRED